MVSMVEVAHTEDFMSQNFIGLSIIHNKLEDGSEGSRYL